MAIDKSNALSECLIELEIIQEFPANAGSSNGVAALTNASSGKDERITLGRLTLNLAEYVDESEAVIRESHGFRASRMGSSAASAAAQPAAPSHQTHARHPSDSSSVDAATKLNAAAPPQPYSSDPLVEEGIIRRYLLTDAKINSTLKISLLVHQLDGDRAFTAPPLKTAGAVFGGGILPRPGGGPGSEDFGQHFQDAHASELQDSANLSAAFNPTSTEDVSGTGAGGANNRDAAAARHEVQDLYRRALAASWACQPGELPADECIEDIFSGGDGFGVPDEDEGSGSGGLLGGGDGGGDFTPRRLGTPQRKKGSPMMRREDSGGSSSTGEANDFLRPEGALKRNGAGGGSGRRRNHARSGSGESVSTLRFHDGRPRSGSGSGGGHQRVGVHRRHGSKDSSLQSSVLGGSSMRRDSLASLTGSTMEGERSRSGLKSAREVQEREVREDFVAWTLPGTA